MTRAIAVLRAFSSEKPHWTLSEITQGCGLDKGTTRRLLHTLALAGLVEHDEAAQAYSLTLGVLELTSHVHQGSDLQTFARPILSDLAEACGGTSFLWVYEKGAGVCLDRVCAKTSIITTLIAAGNRTSLNCGAGPRILMAYLDEGERERVLAQKQPSRTSHSVTEPAELRPICATIRARGYEYVADDFIIGLTALGVPIFDPAGRFVGAFSVTNLTDRLGASDGKPLLLDTVQDAARRLGHFNSKRP